MLLQICNCNSCTIVSLIICIVKQNNHSYRRPGNAISYLFILLTYGTSMGNEMQNGKKYVCNRFRPSESASPWQYLLLHHQVSERVPQCVILVVQHVRHTTLIPSVRLHLQCTAENNHRISSFNKVLLFKLLVLLYIFGSHLHMGHGKSCNL